MWILLTLRPRGLIWEAQGLILRICWILVILGPTPGPNRRSILDPFSYKNQQKSTKSGKRTFRMLKSEVRDAS